MRALRWLSNMLLPKVCTADRDNAVLQLGAPWEIFLEIQLRHSQVAQAAYFHLDNTAVYQDPCDCKEDHLHGKRDRIRS